MGCMDSKQGKGKREELPTQSKLEAEKRKQLKEDPQVPDPLNSFPDSQAEFI